MSVADLAYGGLRNVPAKSKHTPLAPSPDLLRDKGTPPSAWSQATSYYIERLFKIFRVHIGDSSDF